MKTIQIELPREKRDEIIEALPPLERFMRNTEVIDNKWVFCSLVIPISKGVELEIAAIKKPKPPNAIS